MSYTTAAAKFLVTAILASGSALSAVCLGDDLGIRVPHGFEVSRYADDSLASNIHSLTIDAHGRVVVAGAGYVKILHDDDHDGRADRTTLFSNRPESGAHGMYFDGNDLICTGDHGVHRLRDRDGDGLADGDLETWTRLEHPEHGANGIIRGPDGCYYLVCGNDAGISAEHAMLATSPVKQPHSGGVVRFSPEGRVLDVFSHGFRNPYDIDFTAAGWLLTVDSDGERDHHLPWYAPTRMFDVAQGREHGWLLKGWAQSWNRPQSFFDNVERAAEFGRGSPTGLVVYRHRQFPRHYRGGAFAACWTFGRIYYVPQNNDASGFGQPEVFLETTGDAGFAPCDLAVGPDGDLFVAIGGRHTQGAVFRIRYRNAERAHAPTVALHQVLTADQPLASWSRTVWTPQANSLGRDTFVAALANQKLSTAERMRATEILVELFEGLRPSEATQALPSADAQLRARIAWALGRSSYERESLPILAKLTSDDAPDVKRFAWEALATCASLDKSVEPQPAWTDGLNHPVRRVRAAAINVARGSGSASYEHFLRTARLPDDARRLKLARTWVALQNKTPRLSSEQFERCIEIAGAPSEDASLRAEAVRLMQLALGDIRLQAGAAEVYAGYQAQDLAALEPARRSAVSDRLSPAFPTGNAELDRELARLLGMLASSSSNLLDSLAVQWTANSTVEDDIHYLIVASLIPGKRPSEFTAACARCLLTLHPKLSRAEKFTSRNWPDRVGEACDELLKRDPNLAKVIASSELLAHPGQTIFVEKLPAELRAAATRALWKRLEAAEVPPTAELVALIAQLPATEAAPVLRPYWVQPALRDAVVLALAQRPEPQDRDKFIEALGSPQPQVVEQIAYALPALGVAHTTTELTAALRALKHACSLGKQPEPRTALMRLLEFWTEDGADVEWDPDPTKQWIGWYETLAGYYPAEYARLKATSSTDLAAWRERSALIDWDAGDANAGRQVFELRSCHRCHQQNGRLGPDLKGAVTRMSRDDLFTAILDPNLEVSAAYRTTLLATDAGQVYHGIVVYESPESTLLQTGPDQTVRVTSTEAAAMRPSNQSLMPTGLLDPLTDRQIADLYAYLKTLGGDALNK